MAKIKEEEEGRAYPILMLSSVMLQEGGNITSGIGKFVGDMIAAPAKISEGLTRGIEEGKPISKAMGMVSVVIGDAAVGFVDLTSSILNSGEIAAAAGAEGMKSAGPLMSNVGTILGELVVGVSEGVKSFMETTEDAGSSLTLGFSETISPTVGEGLYMQTPEYKTGYAAGQAFASGLIEKIKVVSPKTPSPTEIKRIASERMLLLAPGERRGFAAGYEEALKGLITPISDISETPQMLRLTTEEVERSHRIVPRDKIAASLSEMQGRPEKAKRMSKTRKENIKEINRLSARTGIVVGKAVNTVVPF